MHTTNNHTSSPGPLSPTTTSEHSNVLISSNATLNIGVSDGQDLGRLARNTGQAISYAQNLVGVPGDVETSLPLVVAVEREMIVCVPGEGGGCAAVGLLGVSLGVGQVVVLGCVDVDWVFVSNVIEVFEVKEKKNSPICGPGTPAFMTAEPELLIMTEVSLEYWPHS